MVTTTGLVALILLKAATLSTVAKKCWSRVNRFHCSYLLARCIRLQRGSPTGLWGIQEHRDTTSSRISTTSPSPFYKVINDATGMPASAMRTSAVTTYLHLHSADSYQTWKLYSSTSTTVLAISQRGAETAA